MSVRGWSAGLLFRTLMTWQSTRVLTGKAEAGLRREQQTMVTATPNMKSRAGWRYSASDSESPQPTPKGWKRCICIRETAAFPFRVIDRGHKLYTCGEWRAISSKLRSKVKTVSLCETSNLCSSALTSAPLEYSAEHGLWGGGAGPILLPSLPSSTIRGCRRRRKRQSKALNELFFKENYKGLKVQGLKRLTKA